MGYVSPPGVMEALKNVHSKDEQKRKASRKTVEEGMQAYEDYKASMRSGIFGIIIGKALFRPTTRMP